MRALPHSREGSFSRNAEGQSSPRPPATDQPRWRPSSEDAAGRRSERWQAVAAALGGDSAEWGERWQALDLSRQPTRNDRCDVPGCPNMPKGRLCCTHHRHKRLYGDPTAGRFSPKTGPDVGSVVGCGRPYRAKGRCHRHHQQSLGRGRAALRQPLTAAGAVLDDYAPPA